MKILVTIPFKETQKEKIRSAAGENELIFMPGSEVTEHIVEDVDIIMGNLPVPLIKAAKQLKWFQLNSAGADVYCKPGILKDTTILTNASGAYDISVSEGMLAGTMAMMRNLYAYYDNQKRNLWHDEGNTVSPYGATVVVAGLGNIGLSYARKMKALGSYIIGIKRHASEVPEGVDEVCTMDQLDECLKRADVVAAVLPGTPETEHLFGKEQFEFMKNSAFFVNAGRGTSVDTEALCDALEAGELAGAMLDVTEVEPLPADSRLWQTKNLFITPHVTGGFHIPVTLELIAGICTRNLTHYLNGEEMESVVNRKLGY